MNIEELKQKALDAIENPDDSVVEVCFEMAANPAAVLELIWQRDELIAALWEIAEWTNRYTAPGHPISTVARKAIAKAEG